MLEVRAFAFLTVELRLTELIAHILGLKRLLAILDALNKFGV